MRVYKFLEQEPKIYGLRIRDWYFIVILGGGCIFALQILGFIGLDLGIYGTLIVALLVAASIFLLRKSNKEKCPNFLDAYISYKLYQPRYIKPNTDILKASKSK